MTWRADGLLQILSDHSNLGPYFGAADVATTNIEGRLDIYGKCRESSCAGLNVVLKPRLRFYRTNDSIGLPAPKTASLPEGYLVGDIGANSNWSVGKRYIGWGPGLLYSPTNRLFPDNGGSQPRREAEGKVLAMTAATVASKWTVSGLVANPYTITDDGSTSNGTLLLARAEMRGDTENPLTIGLVAGGGGGLARYAGAYAQKLISDAWTVGAEVSGSSGYAHPTSSSVLELTANQEKFRYDALANLRYGLPSGGELGIEFIYNGYHLSDSEYANPALAVSPAGGEWQSRNFLRHPLADRRYLLLQGSSPKLFGDRRYSVIFRSLNGLDFGGGMDFIELAYSPTDRLTAFIGLTRTRGSSRSAITGALDRDVYIAVQAYF